MLSLFQILLMLLSIAKFIIIVQIVMSWLINFEVLNLRQPLVAHIWQGLTRITEPVYAPIRNVLPQTGGIDFAPLVVFLGILAAEIVLRNNISFFY